MKWSNMEVEKMSGGSEWAEIVEVGWWYLYRGWYFHGRGVVPTWESLLYFVYFCECLKFPKISFFPSKVVEPRFKLGSNSKANSSWVFYFP